MTSKYKLSETQLVAIYKLEFYKNKKNWKLYEDVKKEPPQSSSPQPTEKLNKTYDDKEYLELEYEMEQVSPHNKAFLHEEPEDALDPEPPDDDLPPLYRPRSLPDQVWCGGRAEAAWGDPQQDWCGAEAEGARDEPAWDTCDGAIGPDSAWTPAPHLELKRAVDPLELHMEYLTPAQMIQTAEEWLALQGYPVPQEYGDTFEEYGLVDDSRDFVRGAHYAPHSSEIDLSITRECPCTCSNSLCVLSVRQLSRAIQRHHSALTLLLREQALRDRMLASRAALHPPSP